MKSNVLTVNFAVLALMGALSFNHAVAGKVSELASARKELRATKTAEIPAKAARICSQARPDAAVATAHAVVTAAIELRPAIAVAVTSAISRQNPELAAEVAAKAASLQPKEAAAIARAAAGAAPAQAARIVAAVCKVIPAKYDNEVATAVSKEVPNASKEVFAAATPTGGEVKTPTAGEVKTVASTPASAPRFTVAPPPTLGPPFTPLGTPTELNRTNTAEIPPGGGRNYSGP
jgi:hypothetical protein